MTSRIARLSRSAVRAGWLALFLIALPAPAQIADPGAEAGVKAGFVGNFTKLVEWPADAVAGSLTVCIAGEIQPVESAFSKLDGRTAQAYSIRVIKNVQPGATGQCQVLYIPQGAERQLGELLRAAGRSKTLTVSDVPGFAAAGGMIELVTVDNRIQFEVNNGSAKRAGLKLSSQLLRLARQVKE